MVQHKTMVMLDWSTFIPVMASMGLVAVIFLSCILMKKLIGNRDKNGSVDLESISYPGSHLMSALSIITSLKNSNFSLPSDIRIVPGVSLTKSTIFDSPMHSPTNTKIEESSIQSSDIRIIPALSLIKKPKSISPIQSPTNTKIEDSSIQASETQLFHTSSPAKSSTTRHMSHWVTSKDLRQVMGPCSSLSTSIDLEDHKYDEYSVNSSEDKPIYCIPKDHTTSFQNIVQVNDSHIEKENAVTWSRASNFYNTYSLQELDASYSSDSGSDQNVSRNNSFRGRNSSAPCTLDSKDKIIGPNVITSGGIQDVMLRHFSMFY